MTAPSFFAGWPYAEDDRPQYRLRVVWDADDNSSRIAIYGPGGSLTVDAPQARWLLASLQAALDRMGSDDPQHLRLTMVADGADQDPPHTADVRVASHRDEQG